MINYDCKSVIKTLLKKWYIVLGMMIILGIVSVPLARLSYQRAENNYNELVPDELLYNITAQYNVKEEDKNNLGIYMACLKDEELMQKICQLRNKKLQWKEVEPYAGISYNEKEGVLQVKIDNVEEAKASFVLDAVTIYLVDFLEDNGFCKIVFSKEKFLKEKVSNEDNINEILLVKPAGMKSVKKIIISSVIFGGVLGCFIVLVLDYTYKGKKMLESQNGSFK